MATAVHGPYFDPVVEYATIHHHYYPYHSPYYPRYHWHYPRYRYVPHYRYTYRYRYGYPGWGAYNYGFFLHNLPRHYFYPKYDHTDDSYTPSIFGTPYPGASQPRVNYVIGNGPAATDGEGITIRIVSRIEPTREIDAHVASGKLLLKSGDYETASKHFLRAMALSPSSVEARALYARACAAEGRWTAAAFALKRAISRDAQLDSVLAILAENTPENAATMLALQSRIDNGSADDSARFVYGVLCIAEGRGYEAKLIFARLGDCREAATVAQWLETHFPAKPKNA